MTKHSPLGPHSRDIATGFAVVTVALLSSLSSPQPVYTSPPIGADLSQAKLAPQSPRSRETNPRNNSSRQTNLRKLLIAQALSPVPVGQQVKAQYAIAALPNGNYQFCTQTEPQDWRLGLGVCFWFSKQGDHLVGYYGYPHSDHFVDCVSGDLEDNVIIGQAFAIAWPGSPWNQIPSSPFVWDREGHLSLGQSGTIQASHKEVGNIELVKFSDTTLTLQGFYRYSTKKSKQMKPPPKTCEVDQIIAE